MMQIAKAVFPAAGLGTRFLPATKAQPKEMLPLVDKPLIQYVIEEAVQETGASSIKDMGKVMKAALSRLAGKSADGSRVSQMVKEKLS